MEKSHKFADLGSLLETLAKQDIAFIVVGGFAAVMQGAPITTMDIDIVPEQSEENIDKLYKFLLEIEAVHRRPDDKIIKPQVRDISSGGHALFNTKYGSFDVLAKIEDDKDYTDLLSETVEAQYRGQTVKILNLKTIINIKRHSKDETDQQRLPVYKKIVEQSE